MANGFSITSTSPLQALTGNGADMGRLGVETFDTSGRSVAAPSSPGFDIGGMRP